MSTLTCDICEKQFGEVSILDVRHHGKIKTIAVCDDCWEAGLPKEMIVLCPGCSRPAEECVLEPCGW